MHIPLLAYGWLFAVECDVMLVWLGRCLSCGFSIIDFVQDSGSYGLHAMM